MQPRVYITIATRNGSVIIIYQYRDYIDKTESKKKYNLDHEVLSHMFTKAIEWGLRKDHPMTGKKVTKFTLKSRDRYVTDDELLAFMTLLPKKWELFVALLVWTGRRKAEMLNVRYDDMLEQGIGFGNVKGKKERFILQWAPEIRSLVEEVLELKRHPDAMHLFHNRSGEAYINQKGETSGVDSIWQRAQTKAIKGNVIAEKSTMHDLRA